MDMESEYLLHRNAYALQSKLQKINRQSVECHEEKGKKVGKEKEINEGKAQRRRTWHLFPYDMSRD